MQYRPTDALLDSARDCVSRTRNASPSALSRELRIGWRVADKLLVKLEADGMVSGANQAGHRAFLCGSKYGGLTMSDAARLRALEDGNRRLKKLLAESMLDVSALKDVLGEN